MSDLTVLLDGIALGESPRWRDGRLWFSDWGAGEVVAVDLDGTKEVVARVDDLPFCLEWLPDGRLLVVSSRAQALLRREPDGTLVRHADLGPGRWNDTAADARGNVFVNEIGFDFPGGEFAPGTISVVTPAGEVRRVADGLAFPNGMAVLDGTLIVAESYAGNLTAFDIAPDGSLSGRRVWAHVEGAAPDGICVDAEGAVWYADVPNERCVRVAEGGEILDTVVADRGCFACALGGPGGRTLFVVAAEWGPDTMAGGARTGVVFTTEVSTPSRK